MTADVIDLVVREIDSAKDELIDLCRRFVRAPSVNPPGRTTEMAALVHGYLAERAVDTEIVSMDPEAPNILGHVRGLPGGAHVVLNAHMDTMPAGDESAWTAPIFDLTAREGRLYGLGMGNMKGALAAMCLATVVLNRHRARWPGRLTMTAVSDEVMFGERGTVHLLRTRPDVAGDFLISGEGPGYADFAPAEKGLLWLDIEARSPGGHASRALRGNTAVAKLVGLLSRLDALNDRFSTMPPELSGMSAGEGNVGLRVSLNAGSVSAGGVRSQVANRAHAELDVRLPPGITAEEITDAVRAAFAGDPDLSVTVVKAWNANWTALDNPLVVELSSAARAVRGEPPRLVVRLPGSDARRWRDLGVPAACYGPQPTHSAGVDDYANEKDVLDCAKIYARTVLALTGR